MTDADPELAALHSLVEHVEVLDLNGRARVIGYACDRWGLGSAGQLDEDAMVRGAGAWALQVVMSMNETEIERSCLDAQGFGEGPSMVGATLREVARRIAAEAGLEIPGGDPWR